mgnify:CR=1 FL=1
MNKNFVLDIIKKLKNKGCDQCDVFLIDSLSMSSTQRLGKLEKNERSNSLEIGLRAIIGKKQSIISSTDININNVEKLISKVFEMATYVPENPHCGLANENLIYTFNKNEQKALEVFDSEIPSFAKLNKTAATLENSALSNKKISNSEGAEVSWTKLKCILAGSNGVFQEYEKTISSYILSVLAGSNNNMEKEYDYKSKIFFSELGDFKLIGKNCAKRAIEKLNSRKIKTCKTDVLFDSRVSPSLISNLALAANASLVSKGTSFLKNKIGTKIFNSSINIVDNPLMKKNLKSKIMDFEGIKSEKKFLVKNGVLSFFFNNLDYSRQLKQTPTGHASRSVSSLPSPSASNLYLERGTDSKKDIIKSLKKGFLVTELMGSSINMSNGDYSRGASGFWIEQGEVAYPVSEVTIAGNLLEIFQNLLPCNDLVFNYSTNAPSCLVSNLTVAGV